LPGVQPGRLGDHGRGRAPVHRGAPHAGDGMSSERFVVPEALAGQRVDRAVAMVTGWSRAEVQAIADRGEITVDGRAVAKSRKLVAGERVEGLGPPGAAVPPGPA